MGVDPEAFDGIGSLDGDTSVSHNTFAAAMHAAGSVCQAVDMVARKEVRIRIRKDILYAILFRERMIKGWKGREISRSIPVPVPLPGCSIISISLLLYFYTPPPPVLT